jgi:FixJ family two-component response regulator
LYNPSLISIVDDDRAFRDSMQRLVKSLGFTVAVFPSAAAFLASPRMLSTDCLVADVHMPEMSGIELYMHLIGAGRTIPTILVTAYPNDRVQERVLSEGVRCYLRKPLEEAALIDCLHCAIARE